MITGFGNNVVSALAENVTSVQTTITVMPDQGAMFAALLTADLENPSNPQNMYAIITLTNSGQTAREICHLTAVKGDVLTVVRGREGTTARGWSLNDVVANFATRGSENGFVQVEQLQTGQYTAAVAGGSENALAIQLPGTFFLNNATDWTFRTPIIVVPTLTNTGAATLQLVIGGKVLGTFPLYKGNKAPLEAGDIIADIPVACLLDKSKTFFSVINPVKVYSLDKGLVRSVNKILPNDKGAVTLKPHDISAVQANGGTHSDGDHNIQIEWDGKLHGTVDSSYVGEFFTTSNPPNAAQTGAYPMNGGDLNEEASISVVSNVKSGTTGDTLYSPMFRCVLKGRGGDQDFKDGASGFMRIVEEVGKLAYLQLQWDGFGSVYEFRFDQRGNSQVYGKAYTGSGASFLAEDGNVYGGAWGGYLSNWVAGQISANINNNNVWVSQNFVNSVKLGAMGWVNAIADGPGNGYTGGGGNMQTVPAGCTVIGGTNNGTSNLAGLGFFYRPIMVAVNGQWVTIGQD
ncbi:hypothetical protein IFU37_014690 [Pantoea agglomerans]|uniref:hypothetical protein n=1 Tax=Enterobacter agglomerans TaxID=549 RepID=UPI00177D0CA1|nr:hypothetical protein [Pantoea agglomerans]WVL88856.1 hypothetical protein IFU37_014690 [Pantoea agglomerans]